MQKLRKLVKIGNSYYIKLFPIDLSDLKLEVGDDLDIIDIVRVEAKEDDG